MYIKKINEWLEKEKTLGSINPDRIVLATASETGHVHSRVVAIREITESGVLFFTQKNTRKVTDITQNPHASMTLWLPLQQREVVLDGIIHALNSEENNDYWNTLSMERKLRFLTYSSGKAIVSLNELEEKYQLLVEKYQNQPIPMGDAYCGYRLVPETVYFYTLGIEAFSEMIKYTRLTMGWKDELVSP